MKFKFYALKLSVVITLIFVLQILINGFTDSFVLDSNSWIQPWRFLTAIFLHGSLGHLVLNLFALVLFGSILERFIGEKRFLAVFFISGILANLISVNFYSSALGASGAIFGVLGTLVVIRPMMIVWAFGLPMPMFIAGILWGAQDIVGIFNPSGVGNIAHLSGMAFGLILGALFRKRAERLRRKTNPKLRLNEHLMRNWEDNYLS